MQEQALSKTSWTTRNLRLGGYDAFAHQRDQNLLTSGLNNEKGQNALTFLYEKGRRAKNLLGYNGIQELVHLLRVRCLAYLPN